MGVSIEDYKIDDELQVVSKATGKPVNRKVYKKTSIEMYTSLSNIEYKNGFIENEKYFKCDWTERKPQDYYLSDALALHIKEMIEIQNFIDLDNKTNILILNKKDFKKYIDGKDLSQVKNIWINQNIIFNSQELSLLNDKGYKYIPKEFFDQKLKEVAE